MRPTVPTVLSIAALALFAGAALSAQQPTPPPPPPPPRPVVATPSSFASVEVHLNARRGRTDHAWWFSEAGLAGPSRIAITYGQPYARGRKVQNGLIPLDTVWRFGANMATALHTDVDLTLGTLKVPHGDYSLFLLNGRSGWWLIVNAETGQWGLDYTPARDIGRVPLTARSLAESEDGLSIYLLLDAAQPTTEKADLRGMVRIKWGRTELTAPWAVDE